MFIEKVGDFRVIIDHFFVVFFELLRRGFQASL